MLNNVCEKIIKVREVHPNNTERALQIGGILLNASNLIREGVLYRNILSLYSLYNSCQGVENKILIKCLWIGNLTIFFRQIGKLAYAHG